jgi:mannose-6-phosphate isomerase
VARLDRSAVPVPVVGHVEHYDWGDPGFIPSMLGLEPDGRPWAELWLGTHPRGPAALADGTALVDVTGPLPYLLKVLAASRPLSLQVHPSADQARDGWVRGVYPDDAAKPELLVALTEFEAFCGVRPVAPTIELLETLGADDLAEILADEGSGAALEAIYRRRIDVAPIVAACIGKEPTAAAWVSRLDAMYPGDPSVVATLLLNHVVLAPGEALHLGAGNLHAYLGGAGVELMGPSDNVIRGGLTAKPVDVDELLRIVDPSPLDQPVITPVDDRYDLPDAGCALLALAAGVTHRSIGHELAVTIDGDTLYLPPGAPLTTRTTTYVATPAPMSM